MRGIFLFPGVQNTIHVMQETGQNYGVFKSLLRKHIQELLNEMFAKYRDQQKKRVKKEQPAFFVRKISQVIESLRCCPMHTRGIETSFRLTRGGSNGFADCCGRV